MARISGQLLDLIDIHIDVPAVKLRELTGETPPETEFNHDSQSRYRRSFIADVIAHLPKEQLSIEAMFKHCR